MTELSRSLLNAAREGLGPDPEVAARVRARVGAAVGAPVAKPTAAKPIPAGGSGMLLKLGAVVLVAGVITGGLALRRDAHVESPRVSAASTQPDVPEPATLRSTREERGPTPFVSAPTKGVRPLSPASLSREVELIDQAMAALRRNEPAAALASMKTFDRETLGRAQMAEEAAAITIEARCGLGEDVAARIEAFDRAWPTSAERARITDACR
jgi:hypothetical protein